MATILIVDDSTVDQRLAAGFVEKAGCTAAFARDGSEALDLIAKSPPDAVLTDLQMPGMNGLQLVEGIRLAYPGIPVVLMTAFGSEDIAVQALRAGAASYVPKQDLKRHLAEALRTVLETVQAKQERRHLSALFQQRQSTFVLGYESGSLVALVNYFQNALQQLDFGDEADLIQVGMALSEALNNAIDHGNLELDSGLREEPGEVYCQLRSERTKHSPYCQRRVHVTERLTSTEARFTIRDEGPGFDPSSLPDPTDPENLLKPSGRGIMLIRTFMDEVSFSESGNEITLVKRKAKAKS